MTEFDPRQDFESVAEALAEVMEQERPLDALMAVARHNIMNDEYGFAQDLITAYQEDTYEN
jgi:hypothetical protein